VASLSRTLPQKIRAVRHPYLLLLLLSLAVPCRPPTPRKTRWRRRSPSVRAPRAGAGKTSPLAMDPMGTATAPAPRYPGVRGELGTGAGHAPRRPPPPPNPSSRRRRHQPRIASSLASRRKRRKEQTATKRKRFRTREISVLAMANEDEQIPEFFIWGTGRSFTALLGS
jgi:hypothetical protein